ncbi:c peroxidase, mitochondrial [Seminavis robusta]|uniref:C peroxidase, mitochondrial n=1 Tax=Seminavis robusta TaxID=568900 RepID=A0A9N8DIE3_9STRA|nr:c peroxidase, mitochondrial [Seminavis robusta]|eukprot:Sro161_g072520.1 c peroxidase, mitochondrial (706) ;mRNA; f:55977-58402
MAVQVSAEGSVDTDKACYLLGESIMIKFQTDDPEEDDWVGIYHFDASNGDAEPSMWLWTCGTQKCWGKANRGRLTFGGTGAIADYEDEWPLDHGTYVAVLARNAAEDDASGYDVYAYSEVFRVKGYDGQCGVSESPALSPQFTSFSPITGVPMTMDPTGETPVAPPNLGYPTTADYTVPPTNSELPSSRPSTSYYPSMNPSGKPSSTGYTIPPTNSEVPSSRPSTSYYPSRNPSGRPSSTGYTVPPTNSEVPSSRPSTSYYPSRTHLEDSTPNPSHVPSSYPTTSTIPSSYNPYATTKGPLPYAATPLPKPPMSLTPTIYPTVKPGSTAPSTSSRPSYYPNSNPVAATDEPSTRPSMGPSNYSPTYDSTETPATESMDSMASVIAAAKQDVGQLIIAQPSLSALFLRLTFHDCLGGCNGCINLANRDNRMLNIAIDILEPCVQKYEPYGLSRPDIWVLASSVGVELAMPDTAFVAIPFKTYGRKSCDPADIIEGPNPVFCDPNLGTDDLLAFFRAHFGFSPQETAAILGAHTIGVMHRESLGYDSPNGWTVDNDVFNNGYYRELVGAGRTIREQYTRAANWKQKFIDNRGMEEGVPNVFQWEGYPNQKKIVMTNADIALVRQLHAGNKAANGKVACQFVPRSGNEPTCPMARSDLFVEMVRYRNDNHAFLEDFREAFIKLTMTGYLVDPYGCDSDGICGLIRVPI